VSAGGKRRHPRGFENIGVGADRPAWWAADPGRGRRRRPRRAAQARRTEDRGRRCWRRRWPRPSGGITTGRG